jgi:hypothetical protein
MKPFHKTLRTPAESLLSADFNQLKRMPKSSDPVIPENKNQVDEAPGGHKQLSVAQRTQVMARYTTLKETMGRRAVGKVCKEFNIHRETFYQIEATFFDSGDFSRKSGSGRKTKISSKVKRLLKQKAKKANYRFTWSRMATDINKHLSPAERICPSTLCRFSKLKAWRTVRRLTKPKLTPEQEEERQRWAKKYLETPRRVIVDLDESWTFGFDLGGSLKLPPDVETPAEPLESKRYIDKVMMLSAIAEPNVTHGFDGKICFARVSETVEAKRNSKNRKKGDIYEKDITMNSEKFHSMMHSKVIPAIREKMTWTKKVWVQLDNASAHVGYDGLKQLNDHCKKFKDPAIEFFAQPAKSPDLNANDLGFFNSIKKQIDYEHVGAIDREKLCRVARKVWNNYPKETLGNIFRAKFTRIQQIAKNGGKFIKMTHNS